MALMLGRHLLAVASELRFEPTAKRVRCLLGDRTLADTTEAVLVWEPHRIVPVYAVPLDDFAADLVPVALPPVDLDLLPEVMGTKDFAVHTTPGQAFHVRVDGTERHAAAFRPDDPDLHDHLVLEFTAFTWVEETDEPVPAHPRDPFKRIDVLTSDRHVEVSLNGTLLAESRRPLALFETGLPTRWYLPREDVRMDLMAPTPLHTLCAYKGQASYFSVVDAGQAGQNLAWTYPHPLQEAQRLRGLVAFFDERIDLVVDGVLAGRPQTVWSEPLA